MDALQVIHCAHQFGSRSATNGNFTIIREHLLLKCGRYPDQSAGEPRANSLASTFPFRLTRIWDGNNQSREADSSRIKGGEQATPPHGSLRLIQFLPGEPNALPFACRVDRRGKPWRQGRRKGARTAIACVESAGLMCKYRQDSGGRETVESLTRVWHARLLQRVQPKYSSACASSRCTKPQTSAAAQAG